MGLFSMVSCKAIALNLLCFFSWLLSFNYRYSNSCLCFLLLEAITICLSLLFAFSFKSEKEQQLLLYVSLPTIFERAKQKRSWTVKISFRYFPFFIQYLVNCLILKIIHHQIKYNYKLKMTNKCKSRKKELVKNAECFNYRHPYKEKGLKKMFWVLNFSLTWAE